MFDKNHEKLKDMGVDLLLARGFNKKDIKKEQWVKVGKEKFRVDVLGKSEKDMVVVECGNIDYQKMIKLSCVCDKIINIPYNKKIDAESISFLKAEIDRLNNHISYIQDKLEKSMENETYYRRLVSVLKNLINDTISKAERDIVMNIEGENEFYL